MNFVLYNLTFPKLTQSPLSTNQLSRVIDKVMPYPLQCLAVNISSVYLRIFYTSLILNVFYSVFYRARACSRKPRQNF